MVGAAEAAGVGEAAACEPGAADSGNADVAAAEGVALGAGLGASGAPAAAAEVPATGVVAAGVSGARASEDGTVVAPGVTAPSWRAFFSPASVVAIAFILSAVSSSGGGAYDTGTQRYATGASGRPDGTGTYQQYASAPGLYGARKGAMP